MIRIKTKNDIAILREGGKRHAMIMKAILKEVKPGVSTRYLNNFLEKMIADCGDIPSFLNYTPWGAKRPYPAGLCLSINDEVVHGIPNEEDRILKEGDIASVDFGLTHKGLITDMAVTVPVGKVREDLERLMKVTRDSLYEGIKKAKGGKKTGDIGNAIERFVSPYGYGLVEELCGHGVGYEVHEEPFVPNFGTPGTGSSLKVGMVIAIEPMLNLGSRFVYQTDDGYTYKTKDGKPSAHFEHTILITKSDAEILTEID
ncbi:MAG: type I methionyl aminopeptidase [bacterium]|nr:type I methionyl aminopeptidase [bacterium]